MDWKPKAQILADPDPAELARASAVLNRTGVRIMAHGIPFEHQPISFSIRSRTFQLDEELLDAMNYAEEAARRGFPMAGIAEDLRGLCERTRAIYSAAAGTLQ